MKKVSTLMLGFLVVAVLLLPACLASVNGQTQIPIVTTTKAMPVLTGTTGEATKPSAPEANSNQYSLEQAGSDNAQLSTIALADCPSLPAAPARTPSSRRAR